MKKRIFATCIVILILLVGSMWVIALRNAIEAQACLRELGSLDPRTATNHDAERLAKEFRSHMVPEVSTCTPDRCAYEFHFNNAILHFFRLAPASVIRASIQLSGGRFEQIGVVFHEQPWLDVWVLGWPSSPQLTPFSARLVERNGDPNFITVKLTGDAREVEKRASFAINARCLARIGGCRSVEQVAPELWRIASHD